MRNILFALFFILGGLQFAQAQFTTVTFDLDTLAQSATGTYAMGADFDKKGSVFFTVNGLKISGTTGGTISYQVSANSGTTWSTVATDTITNGTTDANYQLDKFVGNRALVLVAPNGTTQSGSYRVAIGIKRD